MLFDAALEFGQNWRRDVHALADEPLSGLDGTEQLRPADEVEQTRNVIEEWILAQWDEVGGNWSPRRIPRPPNSSSGLPIHGWTSGMSRTRSVRAPTTPGTAEPSTFCRLSDESVRCCAVEAPCPDSIAVRLVVVVLV